MLSATALENNSLSRLRSPRREAAILVTGWVQEHLFREFLTAVCQAIGASLDEYTWRHVWGLVDLTESDARAVGSCLRSSWAVCTLAAQCEARCEFSFESVASWVLVRMEVPPELQAQVEAAMLSAQRCRA
jgi:hypothetical protein